MWDVKGPTQLFEKSRGRRPRLSVANLYGLWDWVGMASCMGPMSPVHAYSLWAGLCPEKLGKQKKTFDIHKCTINSVINPLG